MSTTRDPELAGRQERLRRTLALLAPDPRRQHVASRLADLASRLGGDRAALVWLEESRPSQARGRVVVDLLHDVPRRDFEVAPLVDAWERGVPGMLDRPGEPEGRSLAVVSLGSDGRRAWFAVVEGAGARPPLSAADLEELSYKTGEIAGRLLHPEAGAAFTAWRVTGGAGAPAGAAPRLLTLRLLGALLDDDLAADPALLAERVEHLSRALGDVAGEGWRETVEGRIVEAAAARDPDRLRAAATELGNDAADAGDLEGAVEAFGAAYGIAAAVGDGPAAARLARALGRAHRNAGRWDDSETWYGHAVSLAQVLGDLELEAIALDGWANTLRVKGAFPAAHRRLVRALDLAQRSGSGLALGSVHQALMTLSALMGHPDEALEHGWAAVESYDTPRDQLRALVAVAGILLDHGEADLAERAYGVALRHVREPYFRLFALDGWAHAAALRADREAYRARTERLDTEDWRAGGPDFEGQVYLYRGRAWRRLGETETARAWFKRALEFAEAHRLSQTLFAAQEGLDLLEGKGADAGPEAPLPIETDTEEMALRLEAADRRLASVAGP